MSVKKNVDDGSTHVNVVLDKEANNTLTRSSKLNDRSKRKEASKRLSHHLQLFGEDWQSEKPLSEC